MQQFALCLKYQQKVIQRDILCLNEKEILLYDSHSEQLSEYDTKLKRFSKQVVANALSQNGNFLCLYLQDGNLTVYRMKDKTSFSIKGIQKPESKKDDQQNQLLPNLYISDQGQVIVLKFPSSDCLWMWTMAKNSENINTLSESLTLNSSSKQTFVIENSKKPLMRSSSFDRRPSLQENQLLSSSSEQIQEKSLKGTWLNVQMRDISGPYANRVSPFQDGFDLRFQSPLASYQSQQQKFNFFQSDNVKLIQFKLYSKSDYFGKRDGSNQNQQNDEDMIVEMSSQSLRVNFANKGGNYFESSSSHNQVKQRISKVDYVGQQQSKGRNIITKLDNSCQLAFTVLNSIHMVYCQVIFSNFETSFGTAIKLFNFVTTDDCPTFDSRGKTNLCIDDVCWTNNDAFVVMIFNSCSFAVLPRLGSNLVAIFNPTIMNISQKMIDQFQHYKNPKKFNELILPMQIQQKHPNVKQNLAANSKTIQMHPSEDSLIISDGQMTFIFRIEYEPELTDLFSKTNMSYFFLRFCISLDRLAIDPEILEKIPQLLTNKLPLFEFEKNVELDEEEDPGQVIMTASQINPYDNNARRMETNQSFNAEFTLECQTVLLNLKHLLMGLRWAKNIPLNYSQWLITVINDCFFYFLKNSEPVYAFHALRIAEAYCKKSLFTTECEGDLNPFQARNQEFHSVREQQDFTEFENLKKFFDAVHDMYDYHNTQDYMSKTTSEKLLIKYDMFEKLPLKMTRGSGNWRFQFSKNYTLLVYYSLIQFRNYQAANFNILFLVFACYILQRYLDSMFSYHLSRIIEIVYRNFQLQKKSDDYELFLGKSGKNYIIGPPEKMKIYQDWINNVFKLSLDHISGLYEQENMENILDICVNEMGGKWEKIEKNIKYLGENAAVFKLVHLLNLHYEGHANNQKEILELISQTAIQIKETTEENDQALQKKIQQINLGLMISLITSLAMRNQVSSSQVKINVQGLFQTLHRMAISTNHQDSTFQSESISSIINENLISQDNVGSLKSQKCLLEDLDSITKSQILSVLCYYVNDIEQGYQFTKIVGQPTIENELFKILQLSTIVKQCQRSLEAINIQSQALDNKQKSSLQNLELFQQKANCVSTMRNCLKYLKESFQGIYQDQNINKRGKELSSMVYASIQMLPQSASLILKEELAHQSLKKISKILKFIKLQNPLLKQNSNYLALNYQNEQENQTLQDCIFNKIIGPHSLIYIKSIINNNKIEELFDHQIELAMLAMLNFEKDCLLFTQDSEGNICLQNNEKDKNPQISKLFLKDFEKFSKVLFYLRCLAQVQQNEINFAQQAHQLITKDNYSKGQAQQQIEYLEGLLKLSLFEKYQPSQLLISKAFSIIRNLILSSNVPQISQLFTLINYHGLNRSNKQKVSQILDQVKSQSDQEGMIGLQSQLENFIFSEDNKNQNILGNILKSFQSQLIDDVNQNIRLKRLMAQGEELYKSSKMQLFERCLQAKELFGISFDYSFFFDRGSFEKKISNIFGLTDAALEKFKVHKMKQQRKQSEQCQNPQKMRVGASMRLNLQKDNHSEDQTLVESARSGFLMLESPGRNFSNSKRDQESAVASNQIMRNLMRRRQDNEKGDALKQQSQYRGIKDRQITKKVEQMIKKGMVKIQKVKKNEQVRENERSPIRIQQRNDSIVFENRVQATAQVMQVTRRRDSMRRQFVIIGNQSEPQNQREANKGKKAQHRKGQMSMVPQGFQNNFNFKNQKSIDPNISTTQQQTQNPGIPRPGPPPGLPKAHGPSQKRSQQPSSRAQNLLSKEQILLKIIQSSINKQKRRAFKDWLKNSSLQIESIKSKSDQAAAKQKVKTTHGSFNLLLVKKEGDGYTVQDAKQLLKQKHNKNKNSISIQSNQSLQQAVETKHSMASSNQSEEAKFLISQKISKAQPFQFVRIQNPSGGGSSSVHKLKINPNKSAISNTNSKTLLNPDLNKQGGGGKTVITDIMKLPQSKQGSMIIKSNDRVKIISSTNQQMNQNQVNQTEKESDNLKQQKSNSKAKKNEQYLQFMQKFKQISEKINKVQQDANQLNSDFQNLN